MRYLVTTVALVLIVFGATTMATAAVPEPRVALVIGNSAYRDAPLRNPANDARLIAETLRELGFQVIERIDVSQRGMRRLIRDFGEALEDAGPESVGLFYYAGHGVQVRGENFLIPTGAIIQRESDVKIEAVSANEVLNTLSFADNSLNIVILDACRNNPYARSFRQAARGLARMDAPRGTLVAYATAPGGLSADGDGDNSPYSLALSREMRMPGATAEDMFKQVRIAVMDETDGRQVPWEESSLTGDFYFMLNVEIGNTTTAGPADNEATERLFWESIKDSGDPSMFGAYLRQFPDGTFAELAKLKREALAEDKAGGTQTALLTPPPEPAPAIDEMDATFVALQTANVRAAPTTQSDRLGQLSRDDAVVVTGKLKDGNWYRIEYQEQTAYVYGTLIKQVDAGELAAWQGIENSTAQTDFEAFLASYPSGNFAERARVRRDLFTPEPKPAPADLDLAFWESIKNSTGPTDYQAYLQRFPGGHFAVLARARIKAAEEAKRKEAERVEAERKAAEDARRKAAEEARRKAAVEEIRRKAAAKETERKAAEKAKADQEPQQETTTVVARLSEPTENISFYKLKNDRILIEAILAKYAQKNRTRSLSMASLKLIRITKIFDENIFKLEISFRISSYGTIGGVPAKAIVLVQRLGRAYKIIDFE